MTGLRFYNIMMWFIGILGLFTGYIATLLHLSNGNVLMTIISLVGMMASGFGAIYFTDKVLENER